MESNLQEQNGQRNVREKRRLATDEEEVAGMDSDVTDGRWLCVCIDNQWILRLEFP